jgi:hypothetical protein
MSVPEMNAAENEPPFAAKQREVQRKLGRCLIHLQQFEGLAKALWVDTEHEGYAGEFLVSQSKRKEHISDKTLGLVVKRLADSFLAPDLGRPEEEPPNDDHPEMDSTRAHFRFKRKISMSGEDYSRTTSELNALVDMRNTLVHHFIERFDLWSEQGCHDAQAHLDDCYQRIDALYSTISLWAESHQKAGEVFSAFLQSEEGRKAFFDILPPENGIDWSSAPVVTALQAAQEELSCDGWTSLDDAVRWLSLKYPDEKPKKYGCSSWRHLLSKSKLYEIQKVTAEGANGRRFRSLL